MTVEMYNAFRYLLKMLLVYSGESDQGYETYSMIQSAMLLTMDDSTLRIVMSDHAYGCFEAKWSDGNHYTKMPPLEDVYQFKRKLARKLLEWMKRTVPTLSTEMWLETQCKNGYVSRKTEKHGETNE